MSNYDGAVVRISEWVKGPPTSLDHSAPINIAHDDILSQIDNGQLVSFNGETYVRNGFGHTRSDSGEMIYVLPLLTQEAYRGVALECNARIAYTNRVREGTGREQIKKWLLEGTGPAVCIDHLVIH